MPVLAAIDTEEGSEAVVSAGADLATDRDDDLIVCHVAPKGEARDEARERVRGIVKDALGDAAATITVVQGPEPAHQVLTEADEIDADYIVIGTGRHTPIGKVVLGSVAQLIILNTDVPVVSVPLPE